jgi:hypothetical protein
VVQAIDVEHVGQLGVEATSAPALLGSSINTGGHLLGRAVLIPGRKYRPRDTPLACSRPAA